MLHTSTVNLEKGYTICIVVTTVVSHQWFWNVIINLLYHILLFSDPHIHNTLVMRFSTGFLP